jgi:hypothetical protein
LTDHVAGRAEDLSPAWLSFALDRAVRAVTVERIGNGQTGAAYRLAIDADGGPSTLVAKLAAGDVAARRFLGTSLSVEDRRAVEHDLVASYHAALVARGVEGYDPARCLDDYRLGHLQGPLVTTIGSAYATGERTRSADAMFLAMARRSCAAIRDLGSLDDVERRRPTR